MFIAIIAMLLVLGIIPMFIIFGFSCSDLSETRKKIKQNEEEIHKMIYGE